MIQGGWQGGEGHSNGCAHDPAPQHDARAAAFMEAAAKVAADTTAMQAAAEDYAAKAAAAAAADAAAKAAAAAAADAAEKAKAAAKLYAAAAAQAALSAQAAADTAATGDETKKRRCSSEGGDCTGSLAGRQAARSQVCVKRQCLARGGLPQVLPGPPRHTLSEVAAAAVAGATWRARTVAASSATMPAPSLNRC